MNVVVGRRVGTGNSFERGVGGRFVEEIVGIIPRDARLRQVIRTCPGASRDGLGASPNATGSSELGSELGISTDANADDGGVPRIDGSAGTAFGFARALTGGPRQHAGVEPDRKESLLLLKREVDQVAEFLDQHCASGSERSAACTSN